MGCRVLKVDEVDDGIPSGPTAAMVRVYAVEGCNSLVAAHVPSGPTYPGTVPPLASTSVTARTVPEDALTLTGALGRTATA